MADDEAAEAQPDAAPVVFKKPSAHRRGNMRKRKELEPEEDPSEASERPSASLELMKELQRQRHRAKGVTLEPKGADGGASEATEEEEGKDLSLDTTFTAQTDAGEVDPNMLRYIEEQMEKEESGGGAKRDSAFDADDEELFATPAHLKGLHEKSSQSAEVEDAGRWLAGIVEVQVAPEDKMAAIEATELAKRKLMQSKAARRGGAPQAALDIPSNFNANFHKHRKESHHLVKGNGKGRGAGRVGANPSDPNLASDGSAAARFRASERNRR